jgi:CheY-like chemotaxis protein/GAF domain-containing protein
MTQLDDRAQASRLAELKRYDILNTPPEPAFDRLTKFACEIFDTSIAAIAFPTDDRIWFKSAVGLPFSECSRDALICPHLIENTPPFAFLDVASEAQFRDHPMATSKPNIRFYAGVPIMTSKSVRIGSLFVADTEARPTFPETKLAVLEDLACVIVDELELRILRRESTNETAAQNPVSLSSLSHDLRTPLSGILGMAELLLTAKDIDDPLRRRIEIIHRSGQALQRRLDEALAASKPERCGSHSLDREVQADNAGVIDSAPSAPVSSGMASEPSKSRDILVAEDDADMAALIEELIREAGHRPFIAHNGASVLRMLDEHQFDLVFMDGHMPDMSGFETTAKIRQRDDGIACIPIVALTGETMMGDRERYLAAGMDDYIAKPVNFDQLAEVIERCCR